MRDQKVPWKNSSPWQPRDEWTWSWLFSNWPLLLNSNNQTAFAASQPFSSGVAAHCRYSGWHRPPVHFSSALSIRVWIHLDCFSSRLKLTHEQLSTAATIAVILWLSDNVTSLYGTEPPPPPHPGAYAAFAHFQPPRHTTRAMEVKEKTKKWVASRHCLVCCDCARTVRPPRPLW